jgi:hypothetical protein
MAKVHIIAMPTTHSCSVVDQSDGNFRVLGSETHGPIVQLSPEEFLAT